MNGALHVLLPVHNRRETTLRFVGALARQTRCDFRLLLIDDGSTDGTAEAVRALMPEADVIRGDGSWWWAGALDAGCRHLERAGVQDDDVLLFINDDVEIGPSFLADALGELRDLPGTLLLARQRDAATGAEIDHGGGVRADLRRLRFVAAGGGEAADCLPTRGLFLRWSDYRRTGGFRPDKLPHYLSDYEFTLRAARRGLALRVAGRAVLGVRQAETGPSLATLFQRSRRARWRLLFSRGFKDNPMTWSAFVALATPPAWRPFLWAKIWAHFAWVAARCLIVPASKEDRDER